MTEQNARYRRLGWCLGVGVVILMIVSVRSPSWIVLDDGGDELHLGLYAEERCSGGSCHAIEGSEREAAPKAGVLGMPALMLGLAAGAALLAQLFGTRTRAAMYLGAGGVVIGTYLVFRKDAWVPGPGYTSYVIACIAAIIASALLPDPLPSAIPPRPSEPSPDGAPPHA